MKNKELNLLNSLIAIVRKLKAPDGCPWDREQTNRSLLPYLIEEVYEVVEAVEANDFESLKEELGDLLLHVIFQAELASDQNQFSLSDSIDSISQKLIRRHPKIFIEKNKVSNSDSPQWEIQKQQEKKRNNLLDGVPVNLPALIRSQRLQEKAGAVGFDWEDIESVIDKVEEEVGELKLAIKNKSQDSFKEEAGDLFFSLVNFCRHLGLDSESVVREANRKFQARFNQIENILKVKGQSLESSSLSDLEFLWEKVKKSQLK